MTFRALPATLLLPIFLGLAGCGEGETTAWTAEPARAVGDVAAEAGYLAPPRVTQVSLGQGGALVLAGTAAPNAQVRLAPPVGEARLVAADDQGRWSLTVPPGQAVRLFGLSMTAQGRPVQSEGYWMVAAEGRAAQLRSGAGALPLAGGSPTPRILAVDYDRDGGAVVSGVAAPGAALSLRVDKAQRGETKTDTRGRFSISLTEPLVAGARLLEVAGEGGEDDLTIDASRPGALGPGPFSGRRTPYGWRVDWMTPGGGVQTTQIFDRAGAGA